MRRRWEALRNIVGATLIMLGMRVMIEEEANQFVTDIAGVVVHKD